MVWEGKDAVKTGRVMLGATNPLASSPGTSASPPLFPVLLPFFANPGRLAYAVRGDYAIDVGRNICHGSGSSRTSRILQARNDMLTFLPTPLKTDSVESAKKEIALWFGSESVLQYARDQEKWIYE